MHMEMKLSYEAPEAEMILAEFEMNILSGGDEDRPSGESYETQTGDGNMDGWNTY